MDSYPPCLASGQATACGTLSESYSWQSSARGCLRDLLGCRLRLGQLFLAREEGGGGGRQQSSAPQLRVRDPKQVPINGVQLAPKAFRVTQANTSNNLTSKKPSHQLAKTLLPSVFAASRSASLQGVGCSITFFVSIFQFSSSIVLIVSEFLKHCNIETLELEWNTETTGTLEHWIIATHKGNSGTGSN